MESVTFSPKQPQEGGPDKVAESLQSFAKYIFIVVLGLIPIFFLPMAAAPFGYSKTLVVLTGLFLATALYSLAVLRSGKINVQITTPALLFWFILIAASLSGLFSSDLADSFIGVTLATQSVVFLGLMGLIITLSHLLLNSKKVMMQLYLLLYGSAVILAVYHTIRIFFGPDALSFGLSVNEIFSPIGNWNDLAIFFGLIIILSLVVLEQLPLPKLGRYLFAGIGLLSTFLLAVIQFTAVWVLVGFIALISLMYSLTRHRFNPEYREASSLSLLLSGVVALTALVFLIGGPTISNFVNQSTGIDYLEVRPSVTATIGIAQGVYSENALLGIGPNKFSDAWRQYRDGSLNETVFWNTDFVAGNSYLATAFTTTGALGTIAWLIFFGSFLYLGYLMFLKTKKHDPFWHFVATSSFVATVYLWILAAIYVPGATILILTALCTGIVLTSYCNLRTVAVIGFDSTKNRQATAVLITSVLVVIIVSVTAVFNLMTHYSAAYTFNTAFSAQTLTESNQLIEQAYRTSQHASFARQRALNAITEMERLLQLPEPDTEEQERFQAALVSGVTASDQAVRRDPTDAQNWAVQAAVYSTLTAADIETAAERAFGAISQAQNLYPTNPEFYAIEAQIAYRAGDEDRAREAIRKSLDQKPDYMAALSLQTEIEILTGEIETALSSVQAMIRLQPNNPGLRYQQAILHLASEDQDSAITSLERAIELDNNFANARYVLALQLADRGQQQAALTQLEHVRDLNPNNEELDELISRIRAGESISDIAALDTDFADDDLTPTLEGEPIQASSAPETDLLTPVNTSNSTTGGTQPAERNGESIIQQPQTDVSDTDEEDNS